MVLQLPVHKFGVLRYPYFSTPTGARGPGPYTVPSVVGPGPNSARARVAWVALFLNSAPVAPSPGGARLSRRRGEQKLLGEARTAFILEKAEAEEQQRLAAAELSVRGKRTGAEDGQSRQSRGGGCRA